MPPVLLLLPGEVELLTPPGGGVVGLLKGVVSWQPESVPLHCDGDGDVDGEVDGLVAFCARAVPDAKSTAVAAARASVFV
jgi:hypothetical protein